MISFVLPYPPSINHYYRRVGPRTLISREGRIYRLRIISIVAPFVKEPLAGPLGMKVYLFPADRRRRDVDNVLKALLDALEHSGVYENDSQIRKLSIEKKEIFPGGRATVKIWKLKNKGGRNEGKLSPGGDVGRAGSPPLEKNGRKR